MTKLLYTSPRPFDIFCWIPSHNPRIPWSDHEFQGCKITAPTWKLPFDPSVGIPTSCEWRHFETYGQSPYQLTIYLILNMFKHCSLFFYNQTRKTVPFWLLWAMPMFHQPWHRPGSTGPAWRPSLDKQTELVAVNTGSSSNRNLRRSSWCGRYWAFVAFVWDRPQLIHLSWLLRCESQWAAGYKII